MFDAIAYVPLLLGLMYTSWQWGYSSHKVKKLQQTLDRKDEQIQTLHNRDFAVDVTDADKLLDDMQGTGKPK